MSRNSEDPDTGEAGTLSGLTGTGVGAAGTLTAWALGVSTVPVAALTTFAVAKGVRDDNIKIEESETCYKRAKLQEWKDQRNASDPAMFGMVYSIHGTYCLPIYTDKAVDSKGIAFGR